VNRKGIIAAVLLVMPLAGCGLFGSDPGPEDIAGQFLNAFASGDTAGAAGRTDSNESAKTLLDNVRGALKPAGATVHVDGSTSGDDKTTKVRFTADWDLGKDRHWNYQGELELRPDNDSFKVHWSPAAIHPKLGTQQTIAVRETDPAVAPVLDRDGSPVLAADRVISVVLDPAKAGDVGSVAGMLAGAVSKYDSTITQQSILDGVAKGNNQAYTVVSLREADYQAAKAAIYQLPGVRFIAATRMLPVDKNMGTQVLPAIRKMVEAQVSGKPGYRVVTLNATGGEVAELFAKDAVAGTAVTVTLSRKIQAAAEAAIDTIPQATALVAIKPSTGEILAVAQNAPADAQGAIALTGRFPPGSTFKTVTAASALQSGSATADTQVPCPGTITIGPRVIPNSNTFDKGVITMHAAYAFSCNTSFAKLASEMAPDALTNTARQFGIGVDFVIPGITTVTGSVPAATDLTERAEDGFGQGKVLASPFGLAVMASTVASGTLPKPTLVRGAETKVDSTPPPVPPAVIDSLRQMMREVVTTNAAQTLGKLADVRGKTGTAQFGDGTHSHGWFAGYMGDMAFAVLITDAGSSGVAVEASNRFLLGAS
jgi:transpeptidase family protein/MecA-like transpeptidase family protein